MKKIDDDDIVPTDEVKKTSPKKEVSRNLEKKIESTKSRNLEPQVKDEHPVSTPTSQAPTAEDYFTLAFSKKKDPKEDYVTHNTRIPKFQKKLIKASAQVMGLSEERLVAKILDGELPPLPQLVPSLYDTFLTMAEEGKF